ncbi:hypothetical protein ACVWXO_008237 [Bradyrhizobium sp. LM2.7]
MNVIFDLTQRALVQVFARARQHGTGFRTVA